VRFTLVVKIPVSGYGEYGWRDYLVDRIFGSQCVRDSRLTGFHQLLRESTDLRITLRGLQTLSEADADQYFRYSEQHWWKHQHYETVSQSALDWFQIILHIR